MPRVFFPADDGAALHVRSRHHAPQELADHRVLRLRLNLLHRGGHLGVEGLFPTELVDAPIALST